MKVRKWVVVVSIKEVEVEEDDPLESCSPGPVEGETFISWPLDSKEEAKKVIEDLVSS